MKTQTKKTNTGKRVLLLAALGLTGSMIALPALADPDYGSRRDRAPMYNSGGSYNNGYMTNSYNRYNRYDRLNRINRYGVRGKVVLWGQGPLQGCFRVKRTGRYYNKAAIVTVRYCQDNYGRARIDRGSKQLVRYLNYYRPANGHNYRTSMRRY